ncbi:unnamed protein product [Moneuplotes crassus]|uniref:Chaperone protein DnaJ n=1 Tax=Euplotes crassus TaxID=5936 RepID=A0AAD1UJV1_EUPCR|nr:unnamed protein product [Moneuplotes crassus]
MLGKLCTRQGIGIVGNRILGSNLVVRVPVRFRHSMTNLYESLGVKRKATQEEIEEAYNALKAVFTEGEIDSMADAMMADAKMAYECLSNPEKRAEYDEYLTSHLKMSSYQRRFEGDFSESDTEEEEKFRNRGKDRAKRRFEEQDEFFNNNFMHKNQSSRRHQPDDDFKDAKKFSSKGEDIKVEITIDFQESVRGVAKGIMIDRQIKCPTCKGSRAANPDEISTCYSCKGKGLKKDQLFGNLVKCNTCDGHGKIPIKRCGTCDGTGLVSQGIGENISIPPLTEHENYLKLGNLGHVSAYESGEPGDLLVKIDIYNNGHYIRDGFDIYSLLPVTMSDALLGTYLEVTTIDGNKEKVAIQSGTMHKQLIKIPHKGLYDQKAEKYGDHYAKVYLQIPEKVSQEVKDLIKQSF